MTRFIVVRHGNSLSNIDKTFTGHIDAPLSKVGLEQAQLVSDYIFNTYKVDRVFSSDLSRAVDTIKPFAQKANLEIIKEKELREIFGGEWEGEKFSDLPIKFPKDFKIWQETPGLACPTRGESYKKAQERIVKILTKIADENQGETVAICTHGGLIRALECHALGVPLEQMQQVPFVFNATISIYEYDCGKFSLLQSNVSEYLGELQTAMPKGI